MIVNLAGLELIQALRDMAAQTIREKVPDATAYLLDYASFYYKDGARKGAFTMEIADKADAEVARIAAFLGMGEAEFIERVTEVAPDRNSLVLKSRPDGSCAYLTEENLCRINPVKPDECRTFPFEWTNPDSAEGCPGLAVGGG